MAKSFLPSIPLLKILAVTGIHHDGTLPSMVQSTQKQWLRPKECERWEMGDRFEQLQEQLIPLFEELGIVLSVFVHVKPSLDVALKICQ